LATPNRPAIVVFSEGALAGSGSWETPPLLEDEEDDEEDDEDDDEEEEEE